MDVKTVCLGMLSDGPASGYDLKKSFESSFAHFFAAGYGSIYPALAALADKGFVNCECISQEGKPDRKVYEITERGREYLLQALENPSPCHKLRSEFLAMLCFSELMSEEQINRVIDNRLAECAAYAELFDEIDATGACDCSPGKQFVLGFGRAITAAKRRYIEENRHLLANQTKARRATA